MSRKAVVKRMMGERRMVRVTYRLNQFAKRKKVGNMAVLLLRVMTTAVKARGG